MILLPIQAAVFDAYGTLFDVAQITLPFRDLLGDRAARLAALWRDKQLQYTWLRAAQNRHADFWRVTADALDFALESLALNPVPHRDRLLNAYLSLPPFPDVQPALIRLKAASLKTAILSNGTPHMLAACLHAAELQPLFDAVLSVESVGTFKPHPKVYQLALDHFAPVAAHAIAFISSNAWDAHAAAAAGMNSIWCNRQAAPPDRLPGSPAHQIRTLAELPDLLAPA